MCLFPYLLAVNTPLVALDGEVLGLRDLEALLRQRVDPFMLLASRRLRVHALDQGLDLCRLKLKVRIPHQHSILV